MCQEEKIPVRILIWFEAPKVPKCFNDWWDVADYFKEENLAGRNVTIKRWEYI